MSDMNHVLSHEEREALGDAGGESMDLILPAAEPGKVPGPLPGQPSGPLPGRDPGKGAGDGYGRGGLAV